MNKRWLRGLFAGPFILACAACATATESNVDRPPPPRAFRLLTAALMFGSVATVAFHTHLVVFLARRGLTEEDIWCLIDYVRNLPYETVSRPATPPAFQRERS